MSKFAKNEGEFFNRLQIEKYLKDGCYLVIDSTGDLRCADNYDHALEILNGEKELILMALNEKDAKELREDWKLEHEVPCPRIEILHDKAIKEGVPA